MPLFAFSNAGVSFNGEAKLDTFLGGVIVVSLVLGKLLGISLFSWLGIKLKLAELPEGVSFLQIVGTGLLAGVGFTMSIFVANLAFSENELLLDSAKAGILVGSFIAGLAGYLVLRLGKPSPEVSESS
jgi:NhaA family Na+:H+ antiporter